MEAAMTTNTTLNPFARFVRGSYSFLKLVATVSAPVAAVYDHLAWIEAKSASSQEVGHPGRDAFRIATVALALSLPFADASTLVPPSVGEHSGPAILALAFALLLGAMLMPALVYVTKAAFRLAWAFLKLATGVALHEMAKWLLLAGAASLGLLHYLEWLPALH
jgi:hypothetical protein